MEISNIIAIIGLFLTYVTGLVGIYVSLKVKIKELEVKIAGIQKEFEEHKMDNKCDIDKIFSSQREDIKEINQKLDLLIERFFELKNTQNKNNKY